MKKSLVNSLLLVVLLYGGACTFLYLSQRDMLYHPPSDGPVPDAQAIYLESEGETLRIWKVWGSGPQALLYFGGNAENVAYSVPSLAATFPDYSIYFADYRGFGGSSGSPTEAGLFSDALALYDFIDSQYAKISVIGRSLGSGVAVYLAAEREIDRLVLVTPFDSVLRVAQQAFPVFPVELLLQDQYDSIGRVGRINATALVLVAENDEVIPRKNTEALIAAFNPQQLEVRFIPDSSHNTVHRAPQYLQILGDFFRTTAEYTP